jgi:hypothetical protein
MSAERGPVEHTNLTMNKRNGTIVLDPQITGSRVISLDEEGHTTLYDLLTVLLR